MINMQMALKALKLCGVENPTFTTFDCHDPMEAPYHHNCDNGLKWISGERHGVITGGYRVTEFVRGNQKILPFGGYAEAYDSVTKKTLPITHLLERVYSDLRFSEYGIG